MLCHITAAHSGARAFVARARKACKCAERGAPWPAHNKNNAGSVCPATTLSTTHALLLPIQAWFWCCCLTPTQGAHPQTAAGERRPHTANTVQPLSPTAAALSARRRRAARAALSQQGRGTLQFRHTQPAGAPRRSVAHPENSNSAPQQARRPLAVAARRTTVCVREGIQAHKSPLKECLIRRRAPGDQRIQCCSRHRHGCVNAPPPGRSAT